MFTNVNVDCCKTPGCKNLGLLNSQDYVAQGKNILCRECGYLFPVISEQSLNIYRNIVNHSWRGLICQCSTCGGTSLKKYGYSAQGQRRMYCHHCEKTFNNSLYALVTAEEQSGRVVAISTNYSPSAVEQHYQYTSNYEERMSPGTLAHHVQRKELLTMRRDTLFDIDYGPAVLHQNDPGMLVKPVLPAYRHFELVRILTDEHSNNVQHYLDHECFILGGCLMANLQHIHQGRCHISFVKERGVAPATIDFPPRLFLSGGVRNNVWRAFSNRNYSMAVCNLTGSKKVREMRHATLNSATRFIHFVENHPFLISLNRMSPANVVSTLDILKHLWNKKLEHGTI